MASSSSAPIPPTLQGAPLGGPGAPIGNPQMASTSNSSLIPSGNGSLDLKALFEFTTVDKIQALLIAMSTTPQMYGVPNEYIDGTKGMGPAIPPATKPARNFSQFNTNGRSSFEQVINSILWQVRKDQKGVFKLFDPPQDEAHFVYINFGGSYLIAQTLYDALGWILSVTATPRITTTASAPPDMDRLFYMPLLAVYARWCEILTFSVSAGKPTTDATTPAKDKIKGSSMIAGVWFADSTGKQLTILGSTPGVFRFRGFHVVSERQQQLLYRKYIPQRPQALTLSNPDGAEAEYPNNTNFGVCAETFFYLYARKLLSSTQPPLRTDLLDPAKIQSQMEAQRIGQIRGLALQPVKLRALATYDEVKIAGNLADPCLDCQDLIRQVGFNWVQSHSVDALRARITGVGGVGTAAGQQAPLNAGNALSQSSATAGAATAPSSAVPAPTLMGRK